MKGITVAILILVCGAAMAQSPAGNFLHYCLCNAERKLQNLLDWQAKPSLLNQMRSTRFPLNYSK